MRQERVFLFENEFGHAHIEELLEDGRVLSVYVVFLPHENDRLPSREVHCASTAEALIALSHAAELLNQPYTLTSWWVHDETEIDLDDFWRNRQVE